MIDIDFLILAIKDEDLEIHLSSWGCFYVIAENYNNKDRKIRGWNTLFLEHPENGKCGFHVEKYSKVVQQVSLKDYERLKNLVEIEVEVEKSPKSLVKENQEILMNYLRQKVKDYDNGAKKL